MTRAADASGGKHGAGMSFFMTGGEITRSIGLLYNILLIRLLSGSGILTATAGHIGDVLGLFRTYRIISFLPLFAVPFILMLPSEVPQGARREERREKIMRRAFA
jgi:hypothetical protein